MSIIEDLVHETRVVTGYDAAKNYIVTSFRGSSNVMNFLEDVNFFKKTYSRPGCNNC